MSSCSTSEKSEKLEKSCCFSVSMMLLMLFMLSATRRRVVVGPAATLGLVFEELVVGPPDDMVEMSKRRRMNQ